MKKIFLITFLCIAIVACAPKKPPLSQTQIVDGRSIIIPPEFDVIPEIPTENKE